MDDVIDVVNSPVDLVSGMLGIETTSEDNSKGQFVRIVDFTALGPFMMLYAMLVSAPLVARIILFLIGLFTITYNARNFLAIREQNITVA